MTHLATRVFQILLGSTLIATSLFAGSGALGAMAVLPLIGIVPILFGLYGVQTPACKLVNKTVEAVHKHGKSLVPETKSVFANSVK